MSRGGERIAGDSRPACFPPVARAKSIRSWPFGNQRDIDRVLGSRSRHVALRCSCGISTGTASPDRSVRHDETGQILSGVGVSRRDDVQFGGCAGCRFASRLSVCAVMTWTEADQRLYPSNSTRTTCDPARIPDWKGVTPTGRPSITTCAPAGCEATDTDPKNLPRSTNGLFACNGTAIGTLSPRKMISSKAGFADAKGRSVSEVTGSVCGGDLRACPVMFARGPGSIVGVASIGAGITIASASPSRTDGGRAGPTSTFSGWCAGTVVPTVTFGAKCPRVDTPDSSGIRSKSSVASDGTNKTRQISHRVDPASTWAGAAMRGEGTPRTA
jgi:hypothetical protein